MSAGASASREKSVMQLGYTMLCEQTAPKQPVRDPVRAEELGWRGWPSADARHDMLGGESAHLSRRGSPTWHLSR